jgi:hypothetical protein
MERRSVEYVKGKGLECVAIILKCKHNRGLIVCEARASRATLGPTQPPIYWIAYQRQFPRE